MRRWPWAVMAGVVALDRVTKVMVERNVEEWETINVVSGLIQIVHTRNTGIAFGMFAGNGEAGRAVLVVFSLAVMAMVGWMLWGACRNRAEHWTLAAALSLVMGGAAGNLYDRVVAGSVTDFVDCYWGTSHFPVFNAADSAITVGTALLLLNLWVARKGGGAAPGVG